METKKEARLRRAQQTRKRIALAKANRLTVFRSNTHIYAAVHSFDGAKKRYYFLACYFLINLFFLTNG